MGVGQEVDWVVPIWRPDKYREANLARQREWIESQKNINVNIREMRDDSDEFNKQWLCNKAFKESTAGWVFLADMDVVGEGQYVWPVVQWLKKKDLQWGFGWNRLIYRGKEGGVDRDDWPNPGVQEGGVVVFSRGLWKEMGGANEWIRELRGPDNDLATRARYVTGEYSAFPCTLTHQWHPKSSMKKTKWLKSNLSILKYTNKFPWRVVKLLKMQNRGGERPYCDKSFYESRIEHGL